MKHTQGHWEITPYHRHSHEDMFWAKGVTRFNQATQKDMTFVEVKGATLEECEANSRLIAAAPELLNFIKEYVILVSMEDTTYSDYEKFSDLAKELISKATNE